MPAKDFDAIYANYSRMVYWTAYGVMRSESDSLDVSQTVFMRVIAHMSKLSSMEDSQLKSWLYRVTVNLCVDIKRKTKREALTDDLPEVADESMFDMPETRALNTEQKRLIREAIDKLPDIYRETVVLHYFSELGYNEIASLMGVTEGTVKSRMSRAKARLYDCLKGGEL